jgi:mannosyltransferase
VVTGLLSLTHYWTLVVLAAAGASLAVMAAVGTGQARSESRRTALRCLAAMACGALLLLPWLPTLLFQLRHTGTPWAPTPGLDAVTATISAWTGAPDVPELILWAAVVVAAIAILAAHRITSGARSAGSPSAGLLLALSAGTLAVGLLASTLLGSGYAVRYSAPALAGGILLLAGALGAAPRRIAFTATGCLAVAGLWLSLVQVAGDDRTQAVRTAAAIRSQLRPGDVVVYCPDQLGPAVSRLLPAGTDQMVYPTLGKPQRVDWIDYAERNANASPAKVADEVIARAQGTIWLVTAPGYLTFGRQCQQLDRAFAQRMSERTVIQRADNRYYEHESTIRYR